MIIFEMKKYILLITESYKQIEHVDDDDVVIVTHSYMLYI